jgi:hypothetical protein
VLATRASTRNHTEENTMSTGRINVTLDQPTIDQIMTVLGAIDALLPILIRLTADEKTRLVKPRAGAQEVMQTIVNLQREAGMPPDANDPMIADLSVYAGLTAVSDRMTDLLQRIDDTRLLAGSEGWNESLIRYGMLRQVQRKKPELKAGLDRIRPLITSRSNRPAPAPIEDEPGIPEEGDE